MTVTQWSIEHLNYDPEVLPWQAEIMDALGDPETAEVGLQGPAQAGKSEIGLGWLGWSIEHSPAGFMICQPDKTLAQDFVVRRVAPMIKNTDALKAQLLPEIGADNIFLKQFRAMLLTSIWPVAAQFRARPVPRGWLDDFDAIDDDIDGQGSAITLLDARATTFEGRDKKFVSSSPARENGGGIEAFVAEGTDERLRPVCPSCGERIELDIRRDLRFDDKGTAEEAEATAHVICPASGCILDPDAKRDLLDSLATLPNRGWVQTNMKVGRRRRGFRVDGLLAFTSWPKLALEWRRAQIAWETRQDEAPLIGFFNSRGGQNYRSQMTGEKPVAISVLAARRRKGWKLGTVPAGVRVVVVTVDVQHNRFEVGAVGYGDGLESWLIDRYAIETLADGLTAVQPLRYREHWAALLPLFSREWPLADGSGSVKALTVAIDARGGEADLVAGFWHMCVAAGIHPGRVTLLQGGNNPRADLIGRARRSDQKSRGGAKRNSPAKWTVNVHALKNILDARLRREVPGPGYIHFPEKLGEQYLDEITAEEKQKGKWVKVRPRNETLDLLVMAYAAILRPPFAQSRTTMNWVPSEFRVPDQSGGGLGAPMEEPARAAPDAERVEAGPAVERETATPAAPAETYAPPAPASDWIGMGGGSWL
ncbi:terminase gpA endonuclease subunit [Rhizorhabdus histidinilytica]|uniref:terminase gpA endonuclease subunit n=1 Tax=Rhizorhabdus histidinilytica TaxID=439228 RepID=UPI00321FD196